MPDQNKTKVPLQVHSYLLEEPPEERYLMEEEKRYVLDSNEFVVEAKEIVMFSYIELAENSVKASGE